MELGRALAVWKKNVLISASLKKHNQKLGKKKKRKTTERLSCSLLLPPHPTPFRAWSPGFQVLRILSLKVAPTCENVTPLDLLFMNSASLHSFCLLVCFCFAFGKDNLAKIFMFLLHVYILPRAGSNFTNVISVFCESAQKSWVGMYSFFFFTSLHFIPREKHWIILKPTLGRMSFTATQKVKMMFFGGLFWVLLSPGTVSRLYGNILSGV